MSFTVGNSIIKNPALLRQGNKSAPNDKDSADGPTSGGGGGDNTYNGPSSALNTPSNIYALNVFLNTFLFILVFICGSAWSTACLEYVKDADSARGMLKFSLVITLVTCGLAIAFGELSRVNHRIQVDYQSDLG